LENLLPLIPAKRYFTISEVSDLCAVKPHVLRYWEQEFTQLRPMKRRGNRCYYQIHEVELVRKIRQLLYEQGFTIVGARNKLLETVSSECSDQTSDDVKQFLWESAVKLTGPPVEQVTNNNASCSKKKLVSDTGDLHLKVPKSLLPTLHQELINIRDLLEPSH